MQKKVNLLVPIAGRGQRFVDEGYTMPKQFIMADDKNLIDLSFDSIEWENCNLIFVVRADHIYDYSIDELLKNKFGDHITIVSTDEVTQGSVCSSLLAKEHINNEDPLVIYTLDVKFGDKKFNPYDVDKSVDGLILTFKSNSNNYSYIKTDDKGFALKTAEKKVICDNAAVGVYYFTKGSEFVKYGEEMVRKNIRTNNEFYITPLYNLFIEDGKKITTEEVDKMYVVGTPEELKFYLRYVNPYFKPVKDRIIGLCSDHSGYHEKEIFKKHLDDFGIKYVDFGCKSDKPCDYMDYVKQAIDSKNDGFCDFIFGFCRTGQGVNISANKFKGIFASLIFNEYTMEYSIRHGCTNFFSISAKYMDDVLLKKIIYSFMFNTFDGGRHQNRLQKILKYVKF